MSRYLTPHGNAGGGIVFDSVEEDEYIETINKLGANVRCIDAAEGKYQSSIRLRISPDILLPRILRQDGRHRIGLDMCQDFIDNNSLCMIVKPIDPDP
jgi:hypothetical protein